MRPRILDLFMVAALLAMSVLIWRNDQRNDYRARLIAGEAAAEFDGVVQQLEAVVQLMGELSVEVQRLEGRHESDTNGT